MEYAQNGLTTNTQKQNNLDDLIIDNIHLQQISIYKYLGSDVDSNNSIEEVKENIFYLEELT